MPNSKLYNVKTTLSDGTVIDSGTIEVPEGQAGAAGKDALVCKDAYTTNMTPTVNQTITYQTSNFSRTPVVGDNVIIVVDGNMNNEGKSWITTCEVTNSDSTMTTLSIKSVVETTGQPGTSAQLYEHNIIITTTSPYTIVYLTMITNNPTQLNRDTLQNYFALGFHSCTGMYNLEGEQDMPYPIIGISYMSSYRIAYIDFAKKQLITYIYELTNISMTDQVRTL